MLRLSIAARLTLMILVALIAVWILVIMVYFRSPGSAWSELPSPQQLAAFATLVERLSPEDRRLALEGTTSSGFVPQVGVDREPGRPAGTVPADDNLVHSYANVLGDRSIAIYQYPAGGLAERFPRLFRGRTLGATEFRIGLANDEVLTILSRRSMPVTRFGVPFGFAAGLFGTLIALGALFVMHRETRPIVQLAAAADRFDLSGERLPLPSAHNRAPEVGALVTAFDRLQRRLDSTMRSRMTVLGGISHDVRTFATRLRLRVDRIPEDAERERAIFDIDDMIHLLDDALLASRAGADELQQELVDIHALVAAEASDRLAQGATVSYLPQGGDAKLLVLGDRVALRRIVANATENALKYGRAAHLTTKIEDGCIVIAVEDEGPGIPPSQQALMLEPFTRLESSRNRGTGGAGLGLAIIRTLVEAHAGSVDIGSAPSGGARLTIHLPLFT